MRGFFHWSLLTTVVMTALTSACVREDAADSSSLARRSSQSSGDDDDDTSNVAPDASAPHASSSGSSSTPVDGGSPSPAPTGTTPTVPHDSGAPPATSTDPFANADAFAAQPGPNGKHNAGQDCMNGCHNHGFTLAGTLTDANGKAIANAEIRLVDSLGTAISVYSASNGNFYSGLEWEPPAYVGVRDANNKVLMTEKVMSNQIGCNSCHASGGTTSKITLP